MSKIKKSFTENKISFKKLLPALIALLAIVVVAIITLIYGVNRAVYNDRKNSLSDTTIASAKTINAAVDEYKKTAKIFTNIVNCDLASSGSVEDFNAGEKNKVLVGNDMFFLVDSYGRYYCSDGELGMISDLDYYTDGTEDEVEYLSTLPHLNPNNTYLIMRTRLQRPIKTTSNGAEINIAFCAMMFDLTSLDEEVSSLFAGANNTFIYESGTGSMLYKQFNIGLLIEGYNIYPKWKKSDIKYGESAEEIIERCKNRETLVAQIKIDGEYYYACTSPIDISDWSLMFIVQRQKIQEITGNGFNYIIYLVSAVILILGLAVLTIIVSVYKKRDKAKEEKNQSIINALSENFAAVVYVPFTEDKLKDEAYHYRRSDIISKLVPGWNNESSFSQMLNLMKEYLVADSDKEMFYAATRREVIIDKLSEEKVYYLTFKTYFDSEEKYTQMQFSPVYDNTHENIGFVAGIRNVDKETKEKIAMQEQLKEALEAANYASQAKTTFLFNMSHDIRTPMNAIIGFTNMAIRDIDDKAKATESLKKIQKSGDILLSLINDILEMSRIESGKITVADYKGDVMKSFENITPVMQDLAKAKNISVDYSVDNVKDRYVHLDSVRVQRIIMNLISNAVKYTNDGGWVKVRGTQIDYDRPGYGMYRYTVEDNGFGMSDEFQQHLFEEFTREETSTTSGIQGTGLGLALVKNLTELMGGEVSVTSKLGIGSKFTVDLPFRLQTEEEISKIKAEEEEEEEEEEEITLSGKNVLLVEDNEMNREIATDILEEEGLTVYTAEDGVEAVDQLRKNGPDAYDFILMDIQMPIMNGYEASKAIRELWPDENIIIIALSANAFEEDKRKSIEAGMNDHIAKPINVEELFRTIKKFI